MTRPVIWMPEALADIREVLLYLAAHDVDHALHLVDQIEAAGDKLGELPTGRPGRVEGTFEKSLTRLGYIIAYDLDGSSPTGEVHILHVIPAARNWKPGGWPD